MTTMLTSVPMKEKKKIASSSKQKRSNTDETSKHNPKIELKKGDLVQLLGHCEAELQAKEIALTVLKSEKVRLLLSNIRLGRLNRQTNPYIALFRDSEYVPENIRTREIAMKHTFETRFLQFVIQQKKQVEILKTAVEIGEKRCLLLNQKLENEKKNSVRLQAFQRQNLQLRNDLNNAQLHNKELEQELVQVMKLCELEHERHKKFVIIFLNERKIEDEKHKEQLKQLSDQRMNDNVQDEIKFKELKLENERNQQILIERIEQLQNEIDLLMKEKKQQSGEINESIVKSKSKIISSINELSSTEKIMKSDVHRPTIIPTSSSLSKNNDNLPSTSNSIHTQQSPSMTNPASSVITLAKRNAISARSSTSKNNANPIVKSTKPTNPTSFLSAHKTNDIRILLETLHAVTENRLKSQTTIVGSSSHSDNALFRAVESGDADQLVELLKLVTNPNTQLADGNTCLHISTANGYVECVRHLLQLGANPYLENNVGRTSWHNLSQLDETTELECLHEFVNHTQTLPPVDLILNSIERNHTNTYDYLFPLANEQIKTDPTFLSRLLRTALRSPNTHFLQCLLTSITVQDLIPLIDSNTFISNECLIVLSSFTNAEAQPKSFNLTVCISSTNHEHRFSYAIGVISITVNTSWLELERLCAKAFIDHIAQIDSPFDYNKSSTGCSTNTIDTLTFGVTKWHYQDSPNDDRPMPYTVAKEQNIITIQLKGININSTDSLAYNYFIPSQTLRTFIHYIEQHTYVGVYGAAYLQKKTLFEDLMRHLERPTAHSTCPKFRIIKFEFESVTSLDDCIDELVEQDFLRTNQWHEKHLEENHLTKVLLYFANIQNNSGHDMINLLFESEPVSNTCRKLSYSREDNPHSTMTYYLPSVFHIFVTLSKRTCSTENEMYKKFKWIPFKLDGAPWNGLLKRYLWRRMIDINIRNNRSNDPELIKTLQWVTNVWQRYNECLQKANLQDASLGPGLFFDCPMEREAIFEWLQTKWNTIIAPFVRELSMTKSTQLKSKDSTISASSLRARANSLETNAVDEANTCRTLYVLLQRAVSRDCPLIGYEQEQYLLDFFGSRVEGSSGSTVSLAASSRAGTPQLSGNNDFMPIQLE